MSIKFYEIHKQVYDHYRQKMKNEVHKLHTKGVLPPTHREVLGIDRPEIKHLYSLGFEQNPVPEKIRERFADNIVFQTDVGRVIKKRQEKFNYNCGIIKAKTGMGKTHIVMNMIEDLQMCTLILVTNKKLMQEMMEKLEKMTNREPSQYGGGKKEIGDITVMTKSSFIRTTQEEIKDFDCVLVDECHQGFTPKFRDHMNLSFEDKQIYFYGFTATAFTGDLLEEDLEKYYGKVIDIGKGYDFIPEFFFYNYRSIEEYSYEHYADLRTVLAENQNRLSYQKEVLLFNLSSKCSLILCDRILETTYWYELLRDHPRYTTILITGETKVNEDAKQLADALEIDKPIIIIGSIQKCSTGFDFPVIDTVFLFSAIKFEATVIQSVGRSLRKSPGKKGSKIHVWNDYILDKQRKEKVKAIEENYGVSRKDIQVQFFNKKVERAVTPEVLVF